MEVQLSTQFSNDNPWQVFETFGSSECIWIVLPRLLPTFFFFVPIRFLALLGLSVMTVSGFDLIFFFRGSNLKTGFFEMSKKFVFGSFSFVDEGTNISKRWFGPFDLNTWGKWLTSPLIFSVIMMSLKYQKVIKIESNSILFNAKSQLKINNDHVDLVYDHRSV